MGLNLTVYVGPYFKTSDRLLLIARDYEDVVIEGRGELYGEDVGGVMYLVPNCDLPGVTRQMRFSRNTAMSVVDISVEDRQKETIAFSLTAEKLLVYADYIGVDVSVCWGVVCDLS